METALKVTGGKSLQPRLRPAAGPSSARAPRPPAPRASRRVPPLSREPAEHISIDGVAHPGKVSLRFACAWPPLSFLAPDPGHRARGGQRGSAWNPSSAVSLQGRPAWSRARPGIKGRGASSALSGQGTVPLAR